MLKLLINKTEILKNIYSELPTRDREYGETFDDIGEEKEILAGDIFEYFISSVTNTNPNIEILFV